MNSRTMDPFWRLYAALPTDVQSAADRAFALFTANPSHPGLRFKEVNKRRKIWSARINDDYRALGFRDGAQMTWFWIGSHADYVHMLDSLR